MSRKPRRLGMLMLAAAISVGAVAVPSTMAQTNRPQTISPPKPHKQDTPEWWAIYLVLLIVAGLVGGVNFIPSKRGHQD